MAGVGWLGDDSCSQRSARTTLATVETLGVSTDFTSSTLFFDTRGWDSQQLASLQGFRTAYANYRGRRSSWGAKGEINCLRSFQSLAIGSLESAMHLAFSVDDLVSSIIHLLPFGTMRAARLTNKKFMEMIEVRLGLLLSALRWPRRCRVDWPATSFVALHPGAEVRYFYSEGKHQYRKPTLDEIDRGPIPISSALSN